MSEWVEVPMDEIPEESGWVEVPMDSPQQQTIGQAAQAVVGPMPDNSIFSKEYWTKNVPLSLARLPVAAAYGVGKMAYDGAKEFTDPIYKAVTGEQDLTTSANQLLHAPTTALTNAATQMGTAMAEPLGLLGLTRMKQAWNDPAMSAMAVAPIALQAKIPSMSQVKGVIPFTRENAMKTAGEELRANYSNADLTPGQLATNQARASGLTERTGAEFTPGQQSGSFISRKFEQGRTVPKADSSMSLGGVLESQEIKGAQSAQDYAMAQMGKGGEKPITMRPMDDLGAQFYQAINDAKMPIIDRKAKLFSEIPENYAGNFGAFQAEMKNLAEQPMTSTQSKALRSVMAKANELLPNGNGSVKNAMVVWEEINDALGDTAAPSAKRTLMQAKSALDTAFDEFGTKTKGQIEYDGKLHDVGKLDGILEQNYRKQESLQANSDVLDTKAMVGELSGTPGLMQVWGEKTPAWEKRISEVYRNKMGKEPPRVQNPDTMAQIQGIESESTIVKKMLGDAAPAVDAAVKFRVARDFAAKEYHERFGGTANRVTARGQNSSLGTQLSAENIPRQYDSLQGAKDLVREVGEETANSLMSEYYLSEMQRKFTNKNDLFNPSQALKWAEDKAEILKRYGLEDTVRDHIKDRVPDYLRTQLESKGVDSKMGEPRLTPGQVQQLRKENAKVIKDLFGPDAEAAWRDYNNVLRTYSKNKQVSYSGGSTTAEKSPAAQALSAMGSITSGGLLGYMAGGGSTLGGIFGAIAGEGLKIASGAKVKMVDKMINEAITDPILRQQLMNPNNPQRATLFQKLLESTKGEK